MIHSVLYKGFISRIMSLKVMNQLKIAIQPLLHFRGNSNTVWWFLKEEKDIDELIIRFLRISVHSKEVDFLKNLGHYSSNQMQKSVKHLDVTWSSRFLL